MKTTELYIEQVLIGLLVIATAALPWVRELSPKISSINTATGIAEGSVLLGLAFWLGIAFDRFADTLSERLERHGLLQFALEKAKGKQVPKCKEEDKEKLAYDFYPEGQLRLKGLRDEEAVDNWLEYHRSRIRLTRALAVYGPALTISLTIGVARLTSKEVPAPVDWRWLGSGVAAAYLLWALLASPPKGLRVTKPCKKGDSAGERARCALFGRELPRTDAAGFIDYAKECDRVIGDQFVKGNYGDLRVWAAEWRTLAVPMLLFVVALWLGFRNGGAVAGSACIAVMVTVISTWSWWRIAFTFRTYLYDLYPELSGSVCDGG